MLVLSDRCYVYWFLHTDDVGSQALYHFWLLILKYGPLTRKCLSLFFLSVAILHNSVNTPELCTQKWLDGKFFVLCDPAVPHHMWDLCFLSRNWTHTPLHCKVPVHVAFFNFFFFFFQAGEKLFLKKRWAYWPVVKEMRLRSVYKLLSWGQGEDTHRRLSQ